MYNPATMPNTLYFLIALAVVLFLTIVILGGFIYSLHKRLKRLTTGTNSKNLEDAIYQLMDDHSIFQNRVERIEETAGRIDSELKNSVRGIATVRYNAFTDVGGKQSFATALISEDGTGTALVGNAGYILTRVIDKKDTNPGGEEFLILDGGINMVDRTERYGAQHPLVVIPITEGQRGIKEYVVMGPCCESGDVVTVRPGNSGMIDPRRMGEAFIGDLVAICRGGAYCSSMAGGNYNSQPLHREILARINKDIQEIRLEQHLSDLSQYEIVPEDLRRK
jgi:diaminopimelate decarboxylase